MSVLDNILNGVSEIDPKDLASSALASGTSVSGSSGSLASMLSSINSAVAAENAYNEEAELRNQAENLG